MVPGPWGRTAEVPHAFDVCFVGHADHVSHGQLFEIDAFIVVVVAVFPVQVLSRWISIVHPAVDDDRVRAKGRYVVGDGVESIDAEDMIAAFPGDLDRSHLCVLFQAGTARDGRLQGFESMRYIQRALPPSPGSCRRRTSWPFLPRKTCCTNQTNQLAGCRRQGRPALLPGIFRSPGLRTRRYRSLQSSISAFPCRKIGLHPRSSSWCRFWLPSV